MKIEDIIALAKAGFSMNDISKLATIEKMNEPSQVQQAAQQVQQTPTQVQQTPTQVQQTATQVQQVPTQVRETINTDILVDEIFKKFQNNNMLYSNMPKPETAEDVLAQIINPKEVSK